MGYRLDKNDINISKKSIVKIATSPTGDVYKYRNYALKMFKAGEQPTDVETMEYLTGISTSRILLPKKLLFYNNTFRGYAYKLVPKKGQGKKITMSPKRELIGNIALLERDIETLSNRRVLLMGVDPDSSFYNGDLYLTDPTRYTIMDIAKGEELEKLNKYQLNLLITTLIINDLRRGNYDSRTERRVKELLMAKAAEENTSDFLADLLENSEDIKQFVKRI